MKIISLDKKNSTGEWRKSWATLLNGEVTPFECNDNTECARAITQVENGRVLVLVHKDPCAGRCNTLFECIEKINQSSLAKIFVMYVSGGGGLSEKSDCYWKHYARTPVGTGCDLSYLDNRLKVLRSALEEAKDENQVKAAWLKFDSIAFPETLTAAYLLMIAHEKNRVSLSCMSDEQWKLACEQYKEVGGEKDADWSNPSKWDKTHIIKIKNNISELFKQIASSSS